MSPEGTGKTVLVAGIACAALDGPLAVPRGETIIVASRHSRKPASRSITPLRSWATSSASGSGIGSGRPASLSQDRGSGNRGVRAGARLRPASRAHGLAPSLILADEPAQWPNHTGERMLAALEDVDGEATGRAADCARHPPGEP